MKQTKAQITIFALMMLLTVYSATANTFVFQENPNATSHDPSKWIGATFPVANAYDGDYNTKSEPVSPPTSLYINYTKPLDTLGATWQIKDNDNAQSNPSTSNVTILQSCLNDVDLQLKADWSASGQFLYYYCYNSTDWEELSKPQGYWDLFEEAITWEILAPQVYNLTTCQELQDMQNDLVGNYQLMNDIDCSDTINWNAGAGFIPIGEVGNPFTGQLLGNNHTIDSLYMNNTINPRNTFGLFGEATPDRLEDLGITNANIDAQGMTMVGAGIVAGFINSGSIINVYTTGNIIADDYVGGFAGSHYTASIRKIYSTATVTATGYGNAGGLFGLHSGDIVDCYATGDVTADTEAGGLIGYNDGGNIENCFSTGLVTGNTADVGGFTGFNDVQAGYINNTFWDINTSNQTTDGGTGVAGAIGKTTTEMRNQSTFTGFDFNSVWGINGSLTVPFFGQGCTADYYCSNLLSCNINNLLTCTVVLDNNLCGVPFSGDENDFNQACLYVATGYEADYEVSDAPLIFADNFGKIIVGIGLLAIFFGAIVFLALAKRIIK